MCVYPGTTHDHAVKCIRDQSRTYIDSTGTAGNVNSCSQSWRVYYTALYSTFLEGINEIDVHVNDECNIKYLFYE